MFGFGIPELILILIIGLIFFGPGNLPAIGKTLGKCFREFRKVNAEKDKLKESFTTIEKKEKE